MTLRGSGLDVEGGRLVFENWVTLSRDSPLVTTWNDSKIVFRVPTPAAGAIRLEGLGATLDAGTFEPAPWRPSALFIDDEERRRLDWATLDADTVAEAIQGAGTLEIHFVERDGSRTVHPLPIETGSVALVPTGPDSVEGYFFDGREREQLGWLAATRERAEFRIEELSEDIEALLAVDRDEQGTYVWLAGDGHELWQWRAPGGALFEAQVIADPAAPASTRHLVAARGRHLWRVWVANQYTVLDKYFSVMAAYLPPGAAAVAQSMEVGSGDDSASLLAVHGVSAEGLVAIEFCGTDTDPIASTTKSCASLIAGPEGVLEKEQAARSAERTLWYALDDGLAELRCTGGVHELRSRSAPEAAPDPVFAPCMVEGPAHRLDASGALSFASSTLAGAVVLSRD